MIMEKFEISLDKMFLVSKYSGLDRKIHLNLEFGACHLGKTYDHNIENSCLESNN